MKIGCLCGYIIRDQGGTLPYKGWIVKDQDDLWRSSYASEELARCVEAIQNGSRDQWIGRHFRDIYPRDLGNSDVIFDFLGGLDCNCRVMILECENCGRIWIQKSPFGDEWVSFKPDSKGYSAGLRSDDEVRRYLGCYVSVECPGGDIELFMEEIEGCSLEKREPDENGEIPRKLAKRDGTWKVDGEVLTLDLEGLVLKYRATAFPVSDGSTRRMIPGWRPFDLNPDEPFDRVDLLEKHMVDAIIVKSRYRRDTRK